MSKLVKTKEDWTLPAMFGVAIAILIVILLMANTSNAQQTNITSVANHSAWIAPTIITESNGTLIALNTTPYALFNISVSGCTTVAVYEKWLTPTYANLSINSQIYNLTLYNATLYQGNCWVKLNNISWYPGLSTSNFSFYYQAPTTTTSISTSTTINTTTSTSVTSTLSTTTTTPIGSTTTIIQATSAKKGGVVWWIVGIVALIIIAGGAYWYLKDKMIT